MYALTVYHAAITVAFQELFYSAPEGDSVQVCGQLSSDSEAVIPIIVPLSLGGGSAVQNVDFTISSQSLIFQPGSMVTCSMVSSAVDSILEMDETFTLTLQSSDSAVLVSTTSATTTVTILDQNSKIRNFFNVEFPSSCLPYSCNCRNRAECVHDSRREGDYSSVCFT